MSGHDMVGVEEVRRRLDAAFEVLDSVFAVGTSRCHGRSEFLPLDDAGRRPPVYEDETVARSRVQADPALAEGGVDWRAVDSSAMTEEAIRELRVRDHTYNRLLADRLSPPGFADAVAQLVAMVDSVAPDDWEETRVGIGPSVYRLGARNGRGFLHQLAPADAVEHLARDVELDPKPYAVERVVDFVEGVLEEETVVHATMRARMVIALEGVVLPAARRIPRAAESAERLSAMVVRLRAEPSRPA